MTGALAAHLKSLQPPLCSFIFVLDGVVEVVAGSERVTLHADDFAYIPAHLKHTVTSSNGAGLLLFERRYALKVGTSRRGGEVAGPAG